MAGPALINREAHPPRWDDRIQSSARAIELGTFAPSGGRTHMSDVLVCVRVRGESDQRRFASGNPCRHKSPRPSSRVELVARDDGRLAQSALAQIARPHEETSSSHGAHRHDVALAICPCPA